MTSEPKKVSKTMLDLTKLNPNDAERLAYAEGFTGTAELFARIAELERLSQELLGALDVYGGDLDPMIVKVTDELRELLP
jgi:hypothetical protein